MENSLQNGCEVLSKTVTGDWQSLELVSIGIVINVVTGGLTDYSQLSNYNFAGLCTNQILRNCNCYDYYVSH